MLIVKETLQKEWYRFVRQCRQSGFKMTQQKAAAVLGVRQATLSRFINPKHTLQPSMKFVVCFCTMIGLDIASVCPELEGMRWRHG
jgi:predicted XRE-type DNA-binding protein